ncbi:MAG: cupin [Gammaproteobacteria bacterium]|nr:cupin [Gammaproteobacteria bacterium]
MNLENTFAVLKPDLSVAIVPLTPTIYADLDAGFDSFKSHVLVSSYEFATDWGVWEKHPAGDEIVVLLSGAVRMVLNHESGEEVIELTESGAYAVIPADTWHTAYVNTPCKMLFITPGEGTEHRSD